MNSANFAPACSNLDGLISTVRLFSPSKTFFAIHKLQRPMHCTPPPLHSPSPPPPPSILSFWQLKYGGGFTVRANHAQKYRRERKSETISGLIVGDNGRHLRAAFQIIPDPVRLGEKTARPPRFVRVTRERCQNS